MGPHGFTVVCAGKSWNEWIDIVVQQVTVAVSMLPRWWESRVDVEDVVGIMAGASTALRVAATTVVMVWETTSMVVSVMMRSCAPASTPS